MVNAVRVDVEDYFHVTAFEQCIRPAAWHFRRVAGNTLRILDLLEEF